MVKLPRTPVQGPTPHLLNEHQAAAHLGLSVATLRKDRLADKVIPFLKMGAAVRYRYDDLERFIEFARQGGAPEIYSASGPAEKTS